MVCQIGVVPPPAVDGRRHPRQDVAVSAAMRTAGQGRFSAVLQDLSVAGCRIITSTPIDIGERVFVRLPGFQPFVGQVVWNRHGQAGVSFDVALHPAVVEHICRPAPRR
jgi:hypothetical protein